MVRFQLRSNSEARFKQLASSMENRLQYEFPGGHPFGRTAQSALLASMGCTPVPTKYCYAYSLHMH